MIAIAALVLGIASMVLHFIAPRTKTKVDDQLADGVDFIKDKLPKA